MNSLENKPWHWLTNLFKESIRKDHQRKIGVEVERIGLWNDGSPFTYHGGTGKNQRLGARDLLLKLHEIYGWKTVESIPGEPIGLELPNGKVSLEPGSQLEFAVSPQENLKEVAQCLADFESKVNQALKTWQGFRFIGLATNPVNPLDQLEVIPAPRYHIMTEVLGKTGTLGTSMMRRTSSVQINLDYTSEAEAIEMLRVALAVAPLSIALFANSPFLDRKNTGFLSMRAEIWRHTDPARTGLLPEAFDRDFDFNAYGAYLWKMPLMFVQTDDERFVSARGCSLAHIADGKLPGVSIKPQTLRTAVQQLFTEARLKPGYVEVRSVDGQLPQYRLASTAFWLGLLYDPSARQKSLELLGELSPTERNALWVDASRLGLKAQVKGLGLQNIAEKLVDLSQKHLRNRGFGEE
ncbi:hypothetical protein EBR78_10620, partial [bacterium]|nr:hypothetical protein [bacterium]